MKIRRALIPLSLLCCSALLYSCSKDTGNKKIKSVLILGNSIVRHGPAPQLGWNGDWGMAASVADSDFVHQLGQEIHRHDPAVTVRCASYSSVETTPNNFVFSKLDSMKGPDMLIMRFSENVDSNSLGSGAFINNYDKMIHYLDPENKAVIVVVSGFWHNPPTNALLEKYAAEHDYIFVKNHDLIADSTNTARGLFAEKGVAEHPSDKGMRMIKERIWEKIKGYWK